MKQSILITLSKEEFIELQKASFLQVLEEARERWISQYTEKEILLSRKEAADYLNISTPTLMKYTKEGKFNPITLGNRILFSKKEIQDELKGGTK